MPTVQWLRVTSVEKVPNTLSYIKTPYLTLRKDNKYENILQIVNHFPRKKKGDLQVIHSLKYILDS